MNTEIERLLEAAKERCDALESAGAPAATTEDLLETALEILREES